MAQTRQPKKFMDNNLNAGSVPECIQKLDVVQRRLISQIQCLMTIIILPGGQYTEKGLVIHFPLDIESYIRSIHNVQNEKQLIITHTNRRTHLESIPVEKVINFDDVKKAISWLKEHNLLYYNFPDFTPCTHTCNSNDCNEGEEQTNNVQVDVMNVLQQGEECATVPIDYSVPDVEIDTLLGRTPKLEIPVKFNKPAWLSQLPHGEELAFPWLFPYGKRGLYESRPVKLTNLEYLQHRLYNKDVRWRKKYYIFDVCSKSYGTVQINK